MKVYKEALPKRAAQLKGGENVLIDLFSIVSVPTAQFVCVLLPYCVFECMLKTLQGPLLMSVIKWQYFSSGQIHTAE